MVAIDAAGNAVALWRRIEDGTHNRIQVSFRPSGGDWSPQQPITPDDEFNGTPHVVVDAAGNFIAEWTRGLAGLEVQVARAAPGQPFGPPETLSDPDAGEANLAVNANGDTAVAWITTPGTTPPTSFVQATTAPAGGDFGSVKTLSDTTDNAGGPVPVVAPDGRTTVVWTEFAGTAPSGTTNAASDSGPGTDFSARQPLSTAGDDAEQPDATVDGSGTVTAVWDEALHGAFSSTEVFASVAPPGPPSPDGNSWRPAATSPTRGSPPHRTAAPSSRGRTGTAGRCSGRSVTRATPRSGRRRSSRTRTAPGRPTSRSTTRATATRPGSPSARRSRRPGSTRPARW
ncbi:MAG TPA: hypothetical protein VHR88_05130 [Solirubrobacteraceae bacterium]|nr:hypothetical protein [Solirubrobacteraceae bacterium]